MNTKMDYFEEEQKKRRRKKTDTIQRMVSAYQKRKRAEKIEKLKGDENLWKGFLLVLFHSV